MDEPQIPPPPPTLAEHCYRHPSVQTAVHCTRCGRPICPDCMVPAPVGHQCPECVKGARQEFRRPATRVAVGPARGLTVTNVLLLALVWVYLVEVVVSGVGSLVNGPSVTALYRLGASVGLVTVHGTPGGVAAGQYWRLFTAIFLHASLIHIAFNGYALYIFGNIVEQELGRWKFLAIFVVTGLAASAASYAFGDPQVVSVGASGAIFGIFGAFLAYSWRRRELAFYAQRVRSAMVLVVINLVLSFTFPGIDWRAHVGGLLAGLVAGAAVDGVGDRRTGTAALVVSLVAILGVTVALTVWRTDALRQQFAFAL